MEPDFGSWQWPDISRSHLYRGTIAWTPPTAIYREYTVLVHITGSHDVQAGSLLDSSYRVVDQSMSVGSAVIIIQCTPDISRSCISRNWIYRGRMLDPIFWHPRARYFSRNCVNSLDPICGRQFFAKSAHRRSLCSRFAGDNFSRNQLWLAYLSMRAGTHAVRLPAKLGGALTPLCRRVGSGKSSVNVNRDYKSLIWAKTTCFYQIITDHAVYIRHLAQTLRQFRSK